MIERMFLVGVPVRDDLILELARRVDDPVLAERLEDCYGRETKVLGLDIPERETIIRALEDPPAGRTSSLGTWPIDKERHPGHC